MSTPEPPPRDRQMDVPELPLAPSEADPPDVVIPEPPPPDPPGDTAT